MLRMIRNQDLSLRLFGHLPSVRPPDEARYLEIIGMYEDRYMQEVIVPRARQYAWAIPNEAAIRTIMKYRPIVEMAAGSGYWAYLLSQAGADVVAYDNDSWNRTEHYRSEKQWFPVRFGDERSIVDHQNRTLLLVWPPGGEFAVELLWRFAGEYLIYVGESSPGVMADAQFFDLLQRDWESVETVDLPHWPGFQDQLTVYHRRLTEDVNWARPIQGRSPRI